MRNIIKGIRAGDPGTLFAAFLYFDVSFMVWILLGPLAVFIADDLILTHGEKGLLVAIPILSGAIMRIVMGVLADHIGPRKSGIFGLAFTLLPLILGWTMAENFPALCAVGILLGVAGASFAVALPLASRWYPPEHQGLVMGIAGAGNSGTAIAALFAPRIAEHVGWANVMGLAIIPVLVAFAVFIRFAREREDRPAPKSPVEHFRILRQPDCWWFNFFYSVSFGGFVGLASYLVIFFHDAYGLNRTAAGNVTALCVFAGSFVRPVGGYLADRFGGATVLSVLFPIVGLMVFGVGGATTIFSAALLLILAMSCLGMANGSVFQIISRRFQAEIGAVTGMVGAAGGIGGFFLPTMLGHVRQVTGSFHLGFMIFGAAAMFAGVLLQTLYHRSWKTTWLAPYIPGDAFSARRVKMVMAYDAP